MFSFSKSGRSSRRRQRGIFGFDFGSESSTVTTDEERESRRRTTERATRDRTRTAEETERRERTTTALPTEIQDLLSNLITGGAGTGGEIFGGGTASDVAALGRQLTERAATAETEIAEDVEAIVSEARRSGERDIRRVITDLSQQAGSSQQSFVQQVGLEAGSSLESQLGALRGELSIRGRAAATEEFQAALTALLGAPTAGATQSQALTQLVNTLRGATTTEETVGATAETETEQDVAVRTLSEVIEQLIEGRRRGESSDFGISLDFTG